MITKKRNFIVFGQPDVGEAEMKAVRDVLHFKWLSAGPVVGRFEAEFSRYLGNGVYAIAVSSCTEGLILSLLAAGIKRGDKVLVPTLTYCATVNAILQVGARPVFVDSEKSGHINPRLIESKIDDKVKAIIPVHYTGSSCKMLKIMEIATKHNLKVIEDAAHAFDGWGPGFDVAPGVFFPLGTIGDFGCYSFYATKNITCGEGGMVVTKDPVFAQKVKVMSNQGQTDGAWDCYGLKTPKSPQVVYPGRKGNMSDIQAAIGLTQLGRWSEIRAKRKSIWKVYEDAFGEKPSGHSLHLFTIQSKHRDELREYLYKEGIGTGIHFKPLHMEPAYRFLDYEKGDFPVAEQIGKTVLSLPVSSTMTIDDAEFVVDRIKKFERGKNDN